MAHSLEVRSPLLDHRLMELAAGLPGAWKLARRTTKKVFKDALRPWLPDHILDRPKKGFAVPLGDGSEPSSYTSHERSSSIAAPSTAVSFARAASGS